MQNTTSNRSSAHHLESEHFTPISVIQKKHNISVDRVRKQAPNCRSQAFLAHYFLIGNNRIKAMNMVESLRPRRNAQPMNWEVAA